MSIQELIKVLKSLSIPSENPDSPFYRDDPDGDHQRADEALLEYIGDTEVTEAYNAIYKWYS